VIGTWLTIQALLVLAAALDVVLPTRPPAEMLLRTRVLWGVAWLAPLAAGLAAHAAPADAGFLPGLATPQVFDGLPAATSGLAQDLAPAWVLPVWIVPAIGMLLLLRTLAAARDLLRDAVVFRALGAVRVAVAPRAGTPLALRLRHAWVLVDPATVADPDLSLVIAHEVQHHRQGDTVFAWILALTDIVGWCGPGSLLIRRRLGLREEIACDAAVACRSDPTRYARLLARVASVPTWHGALALTRSPLTTRLHMLLAPPRPRSALLAQATGALAVALLASVAITSNARAASPSDVATVAARADARTPGDGFSVSTDPLVVAALDEMATHSTTFVARAVHAWAPLVDRALADAGLPPELAAVPVVESGYTNWGADGHGGASLAPGVPGRGLWMFIPATARAYGLRVDATTDDRLDPARETEAAVALLADLHDRFGDWPLALAAYNQGSAAVSAAIEKEGTRDAFELARRGALNGYVAQVMAAALVLEDPTLIER
jgi:membrane-bound lytic murein transglycosylase D